MVEQRGSVVLIDDEEDVLHSGAQTLELEGIGVQAFRDAESALDLMTPSWCGIVLSDVKMPGMDGMELLRQVRAVDPELPVILITGHGDVAMALQAIPRRCCVRLHRKARRAGTIDRRGPARARKTPLGAREPGPSP